MVEMIEEEINILAFCPSLISDFHLTLILRCLRILKKL